MEVQMEKGIDFLSFSCQQARRTFFLSTPEALHVDDGASHTAVYNHAIAGLMLGEVYGHVTGPRAGEVKGAMEKALQFTRNLQRGQRLSRQTREVGAICG